MARTMAVIVGKTCVVNFLSKEIVKRTKEGEEISQTMSGQCFLT